MNFNTSNEAALVAELEITSIALTVMKLFPMQPTTGINNFCMIVVIASLAKYPEVTMEALILRSAIYLCQIIHASVCKSSSNYIIGFLMSCMNADGVSWGRS